MRIAYLDCASGISGDMFLGALIDAGADRPAVERAVQSLGLPGIRIEAQAVKKKGFRAVQIQIDHPPESAHRHLKPILEMIEQGELTVRQKELARNVFVRLAEAEAKVHGTTPDKVHFHEVGAIDSIADIVGTVVAWDLLGIERGVASPVPTGHGFVDIAHGRCSIPAPATAELLRGIPLAEFAAEGELTTPTGAALLASLADTFGPLPAMTTTAIGYGAGTRDYPHHANLLRVLVGNEAESAETETVTVVETNIDDLSGELIAYCIERLWDAGALDVYSTAIQMKKNRPAVKLTVLCRSEDLPAIEGVLFRETTTLGLRRWRTERSTLERRSHRVATPWGEVTGTVARVGGQEKFAPQYDSCRQAAARAGVPLRDVYQAAERAFAAESGQRGAVRL